MIPPVEVPDMTSKHVDRCFLRFSFFSMACKINAGMMPRMPPPSKESILMSFRLGGFSWLISLIVFIFIASWINHKLSLPQKDKQFPKGGWGGLACPQG